MASVSSAGPESRCVAGTLSKRSSTGANSGRVRSWYPPPTSKIWKARSSWSYSPRSSATAFSTDSSSSDSSARASSAAESGASLAKSSASTMRVALTGGALAGAVDPERREGLRLAQPHHAALPQLQAGEEGGDGVDARPPARDQRGELD